MQIPRIKIIPTLLIIFLILLQYRLWFEHGGIIDMMNLKKQFVFETAKNEKLKKRNQELIQQVQYLQKNNAAIESRARHELGMVKQGETYYQVVSDK